MPLTATADREDALRDDFHLDSSYEFGEEDGWDDTEAGWNADEEVPEEEAPGLTDESTAYLDFLNDEVGKPPSKTYFSPPSHTHVVY